MQNFKILKITFNFKNFHSLDPFIQKKKDNLNIIGTTYCSKKKAVNVRKPIFILRQFNFIIAKYIIALHKIEINNQFSY